MPKSLYIHIPFCDQICSYCDFSKVFSTSFSHEEYLRVLLDEIKEENIEDDSLDTIYIGGGTPSSLNEKELETLLSYLSTHFHNVKEFTIEANPESLTEEKIKIFRKYNINRVSLGAQSVNDNILKTLNRKHSKEDIISCIKKLKENQIDNINLDFIYGFEEMKIKDIDDDIEFIKETKPKHVSFYALQIEEGTIFYNQHKKIKDDETLRAMYDAILQKLEKLGYLRYEVSNFSLPGYESKHNLTYWHDEEYYAAGLSASGYLHPNRFTNTRSINHYLNKQYHRTIEHIDSSNEEFEFLMLNLRLVNGFDLDVFSSRFHHDFLLSYQEEIKRVKDYVEIKNNRFIIKKDYIYTMDQILLEILK